MLNLAVDYWRSLDPIESKRDTTLSGNDEDHNRFHKDILQKYLCSEGSFAIPQSLFENTSYLQYLNTLSVSGFDLIQVGQWVWKNKDELDLPWVFQWAKVLGPFNAVRNANRLLSHISTMITMDILDIHEAGVSLRLNYSSAITPFIGYCRYVIGWWLGFWEQSGIRSIDCKQVKCYCDGGKCCEYVFTWEPETERFVHDTMVWENHEKNNQERTDPKMVQLIYQMLNDVSLDSHTKNTANDRKNSPNQMPAVILQVLQDIVLTDQMWPGNEKPVVYSWVANEGLLIGEKNYGQRQHFWLLYRLLGLLKIKNAVKIKTRDIRKWKGSEGQSINPKSYDVLLNRLSDFIQKEIKFLALEKIERGVWRFSKSAFSLQEQYNTTMKNTEIF